MKKLTVALVLSLGASSAFVGSQTPPKKEDAYRFSADVALIPVPVFVTDSKGDPVLGLTAEDFIVKEEGKPRVIELFQPITYEAQKADASPREAAAAPIPALRRQFLILFDLTFARPRGLLRARNAALRFVKDQLAREDLVAIATYSNLGGLRVLVNFSTDRVHALQAIEGLGLRQSDVVQDPVGFAFDVLLDQPPNAQGFAPREVSELEGDLRSIAEKLKQSDDEAYRSQAGQFISQFDALASGLGALSGRKFVLLLSEGINSKFLTGTGITETDDDVQKFVEGRIEDINTDNRFGRSELRDQLMNGLRRLSGLDVVVHALDISGLGGDGSDPTQSFRDTATGPTTGRGEGGGQDSLYLMANETGGKLYKNLNDLAPAFQSILKETRAYYLLGFRPERLENKGRFRKIQVEVRRPGLEVSARRGYYEPKAAAKLTDVEKRLAIAEYVSKDLVSDDVRVDSYVGVYPGKGTIARVPVFLKLPGAQFLKTKRVSDVLQLEVYGYAVDSEGRFMDFFSKVLSFDLKKERKRFETTGIKYYDLLVARPGRVEIKLVVRDAEAGRTGSTIEYVDVPDFSKDALFVAPPVFVTAEAEWIVARGFDPQNPEPRRKTHPVEYPFMLDGKEFVPAVRPALKATEPTQIQVRVYHLKPHPTTGQPQTEMKFERVTNGEAALVRSVGLVRTPTSPEPGCFELLLQAQWTDAPVGPALFQMTMTDSLAKKTAQGRAFFSLVP